MAIKTFTDNTALPASDINTYLANSGLVYVKSQTIGSAVTYVDVSNAFSADYVQYLITFDDVQASSGAIPMLFGMITSGGSLNTANWSQTAQYGVVGSGTVSTAGVTGQYYVDAGSLRNGERNSGQIVVRQPYLSQYTQTWQTGTASDYWRTGNAIHTSTTSYTTFRFLPATGTITGGTITVYGYRKA